MKNKVTTIKFCMWCGDPFEVKSPNQKYCSNLQKNCSKEAKRESWRKASKKYRENYKDVLQISQVYKLGSGFLSSKPKNDFKKEHEAILKERKRLKLNELLIGLSPWIQFTCKPFNENMLQRSILPFLEFYPYLLIFAFLLAGFIIFGIYYK